MYRVSNKTLFIEYSYQDTYVKEVNCDYSFRGNLINNILSSSCIYYGSSLKGRIMGSKSLLGSKYRLPIIISERNNIIFFPLKDGNGILWINFNMIEVSDKIGNGIKIVFKGGYTKLLNVSFTTFNNQLLKCSRLWLVYLNRD